MSSERPTITCPVCGNRSASPDDIREGYCGHCHDWTSPPAAMREFPDPPERLIELAADTGFDLRHVRRALRDLDEDR